MDDVQKQLFDSPITDDEITDSIKRLNVNKASAGNIMPQHLIYGMRVLIPLIRNLFNRLFTKGEFPEQWTNIIIVPLHKKGSVNNADNYRGIALIDILSKVYISIFTNRLTFYTQAYSSVCECQADFREGFSTIDNGYVLYSITCISKYMNMRTKPIYVAFVDFQKAFDSVACCMKHCTES